MRYAGIFLFLALPLVAQSPTNYERIIRTILLNPQPQPDPAKIAERARQFEFDQRAKALTDAWNEFARELNTRGTVNAKKARAVSKAFHALERCDGWPGRNKE